VARVVVHHGSLQADPPELARCWALLGDGERERAGRFRYEITRRRFVVRRARLRERLAALTGARPAALRFATDRFGKPRLADGPAFSASHTGERWLIAVGAAELGADIEAINPAAEWRDIARTLFAPAEAAAIATRRAFFDCWARKEAFVKAVGQGLSYPLDAFEVSVERDATLGRGGDGWRIAALPLGDDLAGAVVATDDGAPIELTWADDLAQAA
jgi:4'-phosphopantetheinyl transferase